MTLRRLQIRTGVLQSGGNKISKFTRPGEKNLEDMRAATLAGDWGALNRLVPFLRPRVWNDPRTPQYGNAIQLGKFSFVWGPDDRPRYVPFTREQILNFINQYAVNAPFSYRCPESQKEQLADFYFNQQQADQQRFPDTDWRHVVPMYPGGGVVCARPKESFWVSIRSAVLVAVAVVAAVYLGPLVYDKISATLAGEAGAAAGASAASGATATGTAVQTTSFLKKVKTAISFYNKASSVNAIIHGEVPPPPIGVSGSTFTKMAMNIAKDQLVREAEKQAMRAGVKYVERKLTAKEERRMQAEIEELQRQIASLVPADTPVGPDPGLQPGVGEKISEMQNIERQREGNALAFLAVVVPVGLLMAT